MEAACLSERFADRRPSVGGGRLKNEPVYLTSRLTTLCHAQIIEKFRTAALTRLLELSGTL
ncbi:hypothetical protein Misp03_36790 [Microbispora sp. NBRC 16548]|nr:hypothetical protein Misp03_36790 [Microbispora sp. NBRC 16548]